MVASVGLGITSIANENTFLRPLKDFGVVFIENKYKSATSNLTQMGNVWFVMVVCFERRDIVERFGGHAHLQVISCDNEFIPVIRW